MADCILVLGANFLTKTSVREMHMRIERAVELYKSKAAPKIILSGGYTHGSKISEAQYMHGLALKQGVPKKALVLEEQAQTTIGNMVYAKRILRRNKWRSVIIVTSPHHIWRARNLAEKILGDYELEFVTCRNVPFFEAVPKYLREFFIYFWMKNKPIDVSKA